MSIVELKEVSKVYSVGEESTVVLKSVNLDLEEGKFIVILGPSGAGKSTLLNLLGGLESPSEGTIFVDGTDISTLTKDELADYRASTVGFVFQSYNLIPTLTVFENVALVQDISPNSLDPMEMLSIVGLEGHENKFPSQLSGGQQQRVSIARALAKNTHIILCDEPTGALDTKTGASVMKLLQEMCRGHGKTIILVTHNEAISKMADLVIMVKDGCISSLEYNDHPLDADEVDW